MVVGQTKDVIIVYGEKQKKHANYLAQLIVSTNTEDGEKGAGEKPVLSAAIWNEKEFINQELSLSGRNKIIFLGETKSAKDNMFNVKNSLIRNKFGISYGWFGNRAYIMVENRLLDKEEVADFNLFCKELGQMIEVKNKSNEFSSLAKNVGVGIGIFPGAIPVPLGIPGVVGVIGGVVGGAVGVAGVAGALILKDKIQQKNQQIDQQYKLAVLKFHIDAFSKFLGE